MAPVTLGAGWPNSQSRREAVQASSGGASGRRSSLKDILDQAGAMPLPAALVMYDDVLEALERQHATGTPYGEVSVGAISIDEQGRCHLRTDTEHAGTYVAGRGGTHRYAAPEVRRGGSVTTSADAYAATAVFAEALTGLPPDVARDVIPTETAGSSAVPENPVPPPVRRLVDLGMATDESARPPDAGALRDALNIASTAAFPMADWRARGRAWIAAAVPAAASSEISTDPATPAPLRIPPAPAVVANFGPRVPAATSAPTPAPMPWQSQIPSFTPASTPAYGDMHGDRLPPLPGFFRRLGRGDPGIVSGCGIALIGAVLVLIGGSVGLSMSGPNTASASPPPPGISAPGSSSDSGGFPTPPVVGSSLNPGPAGAVIPSDTPGPSDLASPSAAATPSPTDNGVPTFSPIPEPSFSPPPTPAPTPTSCFLLC